MQGRRTYCNDAGDFFLDAAEQTPAGRPTPGDYWRYKGLWYAKSPNGLRCGLAKHAVAEHEDGTVTVSPSILVSGYDGVDKQWHGYLERGIWRGVA